MSLTFKRAKRLVYRIVYPLNFLWNIFCMVYGILFILVGKCNFIWNMFGFIMLIAFFVNLRVAAKEKKYIKLSYGYLIFFTISMILIPIFNTLVSITPTNVKSQSIISFVLIFFINLYGTIICYLSMFPMKNNGLHAMTKAKSKKLITYGKNLIIIILSIGLFSSLFIVFTILIERENNIFEILVPEYALFYALTFLSLGILLRKLLDIEKHYIYNSVLLIVIILVFTVCNLPLLGTIVSLKKQETRYREAFGDEYLSNPIYKLDYYRQTQFSLAEYFYGTKSKESYQVKENVLFYEGTSGVDKGIQLYFDVYQSKKDARILPGNNTVIIRIHGGGWTAGDKGVYNFAQMNKYFASQGYVVFDIQYGLKRENKILGLLPAKETRLGEFTVDDMIRHIGIFTNYLAEHSSEYNANINSVFISGGSAGGHLALATGLGIASKRYGELFNPSIKVKGIIPFYPANGLARYIGIEGSDEFVEPTYLVNSDSPPCLIYQGSHDGLVYDIIVDRFYYIYKQNENKACAIISMPFGGHASDLYFSGYYNQTFLYYMERFLYQYR